MMMDLPSAMPLENQSGLLRVYRVSKLRVLSAAEQVAKHLRDQLSREIWTGKMPGGERLAKELGGRMTVEAALAQLEEAGLLVWRGNQSMVRILQEIIFAGPSHLQRTSGLVARRLRRKYQNFQKLGQLSRTKIGGSQTEFAEIWRQAR
jgi:hypothetical protein